LVQLRCLPDGRWFDEGAANWHYPPSIPLDLMGRDGAVLARAYDRARARSLMDAAKAAGWGHYVANRHLPVRPSVTPQSRFLPVSPEIAIRLSFSDPRHRASGSFVSAFLIHAGYNGATSVIISFAMAGRSGTPRALASCI